MEHRDGLAVGRVQHWRPAMVPAVATGLLLLERVLLDQMGFTGDASAGTG